MPTPLPTPNPRPSRPARPRRAAGLLLAAGVAASGLAAAAGLAGCKGAPPPKVVRHDVAPLPAGSFKVAWRSAVDTAQYGEIDRIFLRDDLILLYTKQNVVVALTTSGVTKFVTRDVARPNDKLWPPVLVDAQGRLGPNIKRLIAFPGNTAYEVFTDEGQFVQSVSVSAGGERQAINSPTSAADGYCYVGLADPFGGRVATIDVTREVASVLNPAQVRGPVIARPIFYRDVLYVGDDTGAVTAIVAPRSPAWNRPFQTDGPVRTDLTVDDFALYVPGSDGNLYVLDRTTGRRKWQYYAQTPLNRPVVAGEKNVYLPVANKGVVALSKTEGDTVSRLPLWTVAGALDVLGQDASNVYLLGGDGRLLAVDKDSGEEKFRSKNVEPTLFAQDAKGGRLFAADATGAVMAIDPVLGRGEVGEVALAR